MYGGRCWGDPGPDPGPLPFDTSSDGDRGVGGDDDPRSRSSMVAPASLSSELLLPLLPGRGLSGSAPALEELNIFLSRLHLLLLPLPLFCCSWTASTLWIMAPPEDRVSPDDVGGMTRSKDIIRFGGDGCVLVRMINSRRPGAGLHGAVGIGALFSFTALSLATT